AEGNDLNPTMVIRWRAFLARTKKVHDPVMAPWHALASLPAKEFAAKARELTRQWALEANPARRVHPAVAAALAIRPPSSLADAAKLYGDLLNHTEELWIQAKKRGLQQLPDPAQEQLRLVFHGAGAAPNLKPHLLSDLQLLPDRASQGELQKLLKEVEQFRATGPGAPPRAHILVDAKTPYEPRVFVRGNPNQPGPPVPRQMPAIAAPRERVPFHDGSGR